VIEYHDYEICFKGDHFFIILYTTVLDIDATPMRISRDAEEIVREHCENVSLEYICTYYNDHFLSIVGKIEKYISLKEKIKEHFNKNVYYELMEKTMHPNRINWIFNFDYQETRILQKD
jgi:hypothetical protein